MSRIPLSTEGRIFARQVMREIKRREVVGASAFAGKPMRTWEDATVPFWDRLARDPLASPFTQQAMVSVRRRLDALPKSDRGFMAAASKAQRMVLDMLTLRADHHTFVLMEDVEEGIIAQRHSFDLRPGHQMTTGLVVGNVSEHALGRYRERTEKPPTLEEGIDLVIVCGHVGMSIGYAAAGRDSRLAHSEINLTCDGAMITGSMKVGHAANNRGIASAFYDVRTVLPLEACDDEQITQAEAVRDYVFGGGKVDTVPFIERRPDYVIETLAAARRPKN